MIRKIRWTLLMLLGCSLVLSACGPNPTVLPGPAPTTSANLKTSSALLNIFVTYQTTEGSQDVKKQAAIQYARDSRVINSQDEAVFELVLDSADRQAAVTDKVKSMGGQVRSSAQMEEVVKLRVVVPVEAFINYTNSATKDNFLTDLAAFQGVKSIDLMMGRQTQELKNFPATAQALSILAQVSRNEGVKQMGADKWQAAGFKGKGTRIGIIDGGFKYHEQFKGSTLPAKLNIKDIDAEQGGPGTLDDDVHGTAVIEIIYSLAPQADYFAASVDGSDDELKAAIEYLLTQNVHIISVSMGGHGTAGDGSAAFDRYIERVRKERGVVFLFASGNEGSSHYSGYFNPDPQGFHQFIPGVTKMALANPSGTSLETYITLNWEQWGIDKKTVNDLDLFLVDKDGKAVKGGSSQDSQSVRDPLEAIPAKIPGKQTYYVRIKQKPNTPAYAKPFRLHLFGHNTDFQFIVPQMSVGDPATSKGALGVGAIQWDEDSWAYYSSQGPLPDGRFKPEISAPAGVSSRAYEEDGEEVFDGTSAATPEAAGIAAILKGANNNLSADQLEALLKESVRDLTPSGPDYASGYGRLTLANTNPAAGIVPQNKAPVIAPANMTNVQFPVQILKYYPAPQVGTVTVSKIAPAPLPTQTTNLDNKPNDAVKLVGGTTAAPAPTSAATAVPTKPVTPKTTPVPVANVVFKDSFKDSSSGLPNSGNSTYQNGSYRLTASGSQLTWTAYPSTLIKVTDFSAEVSVQGINSKDGLYGIVFWEQDNNNYYLLSVTGVGQYQISRYQSGKFTEIIGWNAAAGWKKDTTNLLRLNASKGNLAVYVNNVAGKIGQARGEGSIGFAAGSYGSSVAASFKDFRLTTSK